MIFIDLRDRYGITQITLDPKRVDASIMDLAGQVSHEWVVKVTGTVVARPTEMINKDMNTGEIELIAQHLEVLNKSKELPFMIVDNPSTSEEQRMKFRYVDFRRQPVLDNLIMRANFNKYTRDWFTDK
jgi:aspartyl-tRNA synthetase